ncbi:MAG: type II secretion system F family protein [Sphingobacteriales bacterium]|nr:type II secretion system F family protein [Sphingobacteriales bacterium]
MKIDKIKRKKEEKDSTFLVSLKILMSKDISIGRTSLNDQFRESFYLELQVLLNAGVDIRTTLELIASEQKKKFQKELVEKLKELIIGGKSLSSAMQNCKEFSAYEYYSVQIGEESGKLNQVLKELSLFYKSKIKQRRQLISALTYPSVILFTSFAAIFFMMNFIVPMFSDIFKRFGNDLPWITQQIVYLSESLRNNFWWLFLIIVGLSIFLYTQRDSDWYRKYSSNLILSIPIIGNLIHKINLARFSNSLSLLISSRIPILRAIQLVKQMMKFYPIEISLESIESDVMKGMSLNKAMSNFDVYPAKMISLVKVGEEVNQLEHFFSQISRQYTEEVEHQSAVISNLLEPIILLFLGGIVAIILIAMYLPLFQMSNVF